MTTSDSIGICGCSEESRSLSADGGTMYSGHALELWPLFCDKCLPSSRQLSSSLSCFISSFLLAHRLLILCTQLFMKWRLDQPQTKRRSLANACCMQCFSLLLCMLAFGEDAILTSLSVHSLLPLAPGRDMSLNYSLEQ